MKRYIWGFPGIGKSSVRLQGTRVADADCEAFKFQDVEPGELHSVKALGGSESGRNYARDERYPENYLAYVQAVEADVVLLNCHIGLLEQLDREDILVVYPAPELISEYLQRYENRGDDPSFVAYMEEEAEGMLRHIEASGFEKYRIDTPDTYLGDLFERADFKMKVLTTAELTAHIQRAMDLGVIDTEFHADSPGRLICDAQLAEREQPHKIKNARVWAQAVLDGKYELDIEELIMACLTREAKLGKEQGNRAVTRVKVFEKDLRTVTLGEVYFADKASENEQGVHILPADRGNLAYVDGYVMHNGEPIWILNPEGNEYIFSDEEFRDGAFFTERVPFSNYSHYLYEFMPMGGGSQFIAYAWYGKEDSFVEQLESVEEALDWLVSEREDLEKVGSLEETIRFCEEAGRLAGNGSFAPDPVLPVR